MLTCIYKSGVNCSIFGARIDQNCEFMNPVQNNLDITKYYNYNYIIPDINDMIYRKGREGREGRKEKEGKGREGGAERED